MSEVTTSELARSIATGTIYAQWWFYAIWLLVTALGAALGAWLQERTKGDVTKQVWLAQESWKEKYRLYTLLIEASEEIAAALWNVVTDTRVLVQMGNTAPSTEGDGLKLFPEHQAFFDRELRANEKLAGAQVGVELMLNEKAKAAYAKIRGADTRSTYVVNLSYRQRVSERCDAAAAAKAAFIEAAKEDLRI